MAEYKPNSHKSREEAADSANNRKVQKVISGKAKTKPNEMRKLSGLFLSDDISNVKSYVFSDVLIPAIKNAISDVIIEATTALFGGSKNRSGRSSGRANSSPSYRSYYDDRDRPVARSGTSRFDYDDISFDTRSDAELVKNQMSDIVGQYGMVTVADMYDLAGLEAPYTAQRYGWFNIRTAEVIRGRDGYYLKMPKAMPID